MNLIIGIMGIAIILLAMVGSIALPLSPMSDLIVVIAIVLLMIISGLALSLNPNYKRKNKRGLDK